MSFPNYPTYNAAFREAMRLIRIVKDAGWKQRQRNGQRFYLAPNGVEARSLSKAVFIIGHLGPIPNWKQAGNEVGPHRLHRATVLRGKTKIFKNCS